MDIQELTSRIEKIENRNKRVEKDKAWETSSARIILVTLITYIIATAVMWVIDVENPFTAAVIPTLGFFLSTLSLPVLKRIWIKTVHRK